MLCIFSLCLLCIISCSKTEKEEIDTQEQETMYLKDDDQVDRQTRNQTNWDDAGITAPIVSYEEITSKEIEVRSADSFSVYAVDETVLFDFDKAEIRDGGEEKLEEIVNSLEKRHPDGEVAVKGYTDAVGPKDYNKDLAEERARAVADYIRENGDVARDQISVLAKGEKDPVATNETEAGRQKNRRVEIMVRN